MNMLAPITHFLPVTQIRRERVLPQPGKVIVRAGQSVGAMDVVAEAPGNTEFQLLEIARILGVSIAKSDRYLQCQSGDQLATGDLIAGPVGLSNRVVRAPKDCKVIFAGEGQVLLEPAGKSFQLKAGIPGDVVELISDRGVVIQTNGALIQAVWGNGRIDYGVMTVLAKQPNQLLSAADLDVSLRGSVILSGICLDGDALILANELPLRGIILGSMDPDLVPTAINLQIPIVLIEGFGEIPMNSIAYKLLSTNNRREVALNAENWNHYSNTRPEVVIPMPAPRNTGAPQETVFFSPGKSVRGLSLPFLGKIGVIEKLTNNSPFSGGPRVPSAVVKFEDSQSAILPVSNLEIII
jgi:hypothetical protein